MESLFLQQIGNLKAVLYSPQPLWPRRYHILLLFLVSILHSTHILSSLLQIRQRHNPRPVLNLFLSHTNQRFLFLVVLVGRVINFKHGLDQLCITAVLFIKAPSCTEFCQHVENEVQADDEATDCAKPNCSWHADPMNQYRDELSIGGSFES